MKYKVVSVILGCAVLFATLGTPAGAAPMPRQRSFSASFQFTSQALVSDSTCVGGQAVVIKGSFVRTGRPGWVFDSQTCLDGTSGLFSVTTGSGIVLSGTVQAGQSGQLIHLLLSITHATSRYSGGHFDLTINVAGGPQPSVIGTLIFASGPVDRTFTGVATATKFQASPSPHCAPGTTLIDAAGVLSRVGIADWQFALQACTPRGVLPLGTFSIVTPAGITLTGTANVNLVGTVVTVDLVVQQATREYSAGTLTITIDTASGNKIGTVAGSLRVG